MSTCRHLNAWAGPMSHCGVRVLFSRQSTQAFTTDRRRDGAVCNSETEKVSAVAHPSPGGWALGAQVEWPDGAVSESGAARPAMGTPTSGRSGGATSDGFGR
jgi:hypothetical protein